MLTMLTSRQSLPELSIYMLSDHHQALNKALYGFGHSFGERVLDLEMTCTTERFKMDLCLTCRYEKNKPTFTTKMVIKAFWSDFCNLVNEEGGLRVLLDDGRDCHVARICSRGSNLLRVGGIGPMRFR